MSIKKVLLVFLTVGIILSLSASCQTSQKSPSDTVQSSKASSEGSSSIPEERVDISILIHRNGNANYSNENAITEQISEKLNINLKPQLVMLADMPTIKATLLASGDLPDIMSVDQVDIEEYAKNNIIIPLDDLIAEYGSEIQSKLTENNFSRTIYDGKKYAIPGVTQWTQIVAFRGDWLEKMEVEPSFFEDATLDDFYEFLKRVRDEDLDGNGINDTIPWASFDSPSYMDPFFAAFGYRLDELYEKDGMVLPGSVFPELKEAIKYLRKLYAEKLIDPEFPVTSDSLFREKIVSGNYGGWYHNFPLVTDTNPATANLKKILPDAYWQSVAPPIGPDGKRGNLKFSDTRVQTMSAITSKCKNPEKAMEYLNFIMSDEGSTLVAFGHEGKEFETVETVTFSDGRKAQFIKRLIDNDKAISLGLNAFASFPINPKPVFVDRSQKDIQTIELGYKYGTVGLQILSTPPSERTYGSTLQELTKEYYLKMIISTDDLDKMFEDYVKDYMSNGGEELGRERYEIYKGQ